jgi:hypothetical protein
MKSLELILTSLVWLTVLVAFLYYRRRPLSDP